MTEDRRVRVTHIEIGAFAFDANGGTERARTHNSHTYIVHIYIYIGLREHTGIDLKLSQGLLIFLVQEVGPFCYCNALNGNCMQATPVVRTRTYIKFQVIYYIFQHNCIDS